MGATAIRFLIYSWIAMNANRPKVLIAHEFIQSIEDNPTSVGIKWSMDPKKRTVTLLARLS